MWLKERPTLSRDNKRKKGEISFQETFKDVSNIRIYLISNHYTVRAMP